MLLSYAGGGSPVRASDPAVWWAEADLLYCRRPIKKRCFSLELMIILFLLVLINLLLAVGRTSKRKWVGRTLAAVSFVLLLVTFLFVLKAFS